MLCSSPTRRSPDLFRRAANRETILIGSRHDPGSLLIATLPNLGCRHNREHRGWGRICEQRPEERCRRAMKAPSPMALPDCLLIAADLAGACDAAVHFAMRGRRTTVPIAPGAELVDSTGLAISTDSRELEPAAARHVISAAANLPIGS